METNVKGRMILPPLDSYGRSLELNELSYEAATESNDDPAARRRLLTVGQVATAAHGNADAGSIRLHFV